MKNFLKRKFFRKHSPSFQDLGSIGILLIASFVVEINQKNSKKAGDEKFKNF
jgi:hypothetical protein